MNSRTVRDRSTITAFDCCPFTRVLLLNYTDRSPATVRSMLEYLKWTSLEHRRQQIRPGILYKINNGHVDINSESFFRHSDPRTVRSRLYQEQIPHPVLFHSFFPRTVSEWNLGLPTSISSAPSLESFKGRLGCSPHNQPPSLNEHQGHVYSFNNISTCRLLC